MNDADAMRLAHAGGARGLEPIYFDGRLWGFRIINDETKGETAMTILSTGDKQARCVGMTWGRTTGAKEAVFVTLLFEVTRGDETAKRARYKGWFGSEAQAERSIKALRAAGWKGDDFEALRRNQLQGLGTCDCTVVVKHVPKEGTDRRTGKPFALSDVWVEIEHVNPLVRLSVERNPATSQDAAFLNDQFGALLGRGASPSAPARGRMMPAHDPNTGEVNDDADDVSADDFPPSYGGGAVAEDPA